MHWLLQSNLATEAQQIPFVAALNHIKARGETGHGPRCDWSYVKLVPFAGTVEPARDYGPKVFPLGSASMLTASQIYGWSPGVVYDEATFRFEAWREAYGDSNLINGDAQVTTFGQVVALSKIFLRPCQDSKAFTGLTINPDELETWQERVRDGEESKRTLTLSLDTPVVVAPIKVILREWRFFVVDGIVVAGSQYACHGRREVLPDVPDDVRTYAQRLAFKWQPAGCFVVDIGETRDGLGLVEINSLNTSGVYACDFKAVCEAIEYLYED